MTESPKRYAKSTLLRWLQHDRLTLREAASLICGRDPSLDSVDLGLVSDQIVAALVDAIKTGQIEPVSWCPGNGNETIALTPGLAFPSKMQDHEISSWARLNQSGIREWLQTAGRTDAFFFLALPTDWPDYAHWAKMATWTLREAVLLACGRNCEVSSIDPNPSEFLRRRIELTERAVAGGELRPGDTDIKDVLNSSVRPERFLSWAVNTFDSVPAELVRLVKDRGKRIADLNAFADLDVVTAERDRLRVEREALQDRVDQLQARLQGKAKGAELDSDRDPPLTSSDSDAAFSTRERKTLLSVIGALCEVAGVDLRSDEGHYLHARSLLPELSRRRVRISDQTLANKIKEARDEITPQGPGRKESKAS